MLSRMISKYAFIAGINHNNIGSAHLQRPVGPSRTELSLLEAALSTQACKSHCLYTIAAQDDMVMDGTRVYLAGKQKASKAAEDMAKSPPCSFAACPVACYSVSEHMEHKADLNPQAASLCCAALETEPSSKVVLNSEHTCQCCCLKVLSFMSHYDSRRLSLPCPIALAPLGRAQ